MSSAVKDRRNRSIDKRLDRLLNIALDYMETIERWGFYTDFTVDHDRIPRVTVRHKPE